MSINNQFESPLFLQISFNALIDKYVKLAENSDKEYSSTRVKRIIDIKKKCPELVDGFTDVSLLETYKEQIDYILQDSFNPLLTDNEIKIATIPFHDLIFNATKRFKKIVANAGNHFELSIKNLPNNDKYIIACTIVLNLHYGYNLNLKRPFYYEIPDSNGVIHYYKLLYNADFTEIIPTDKAIKITAKDVDELLDNYDNIDLWKEKFPPQSYIFKGFIISNIFDVTDDQSISNIKSNLIKERKEYDGGFMKGFKDIFCSFLNIKDLEVGFSIYNKSNDTFESLYDNHVKSYLLNDSNRIQCNEVLCDLSYRMLLKDKSIFSVSNVNKAYDESLKLGDEIPQYKTLKAQGVQSAILAPIANDNELLGVLEIVSSKSKVLNSLNANRLLAVMPYILSAVERSKKEEKNLISAIIQEKCTAIHSSVHWRFEEEARHFIKENINGNSEVTFSKIAFDEVYPLYGQIDIKGSSDARNWATKQDLSLQLKAANTVLKTLHTSKLLPIYEQLSFEITRYLNNLDAHFQVDSEQQIALFFSKEITPLFTHLSHLEKYTSEINDYFSIIDSKLGILYNHRKDYDETIKQINEKMAYLLDKEQVKAQQMHPHYFERYKTDGVEHNMYIGKSITKDKSFNRIYLHNLRLWQLQVMCEMENAYYNMRSDFAVSLDVASMLLVYSTPLSISFRMDEKQFDVDGTYNARYEIVKKRVDKAFIKGTKKRITEKGKITIVYSQKQDEKEYLGYIAFLQSKHYLGLDLEIVELQDLQAVTGLKAIRVSVLYHTDNNKAFYTYDDLMKEIKS